MKQTKILMGMPVTVEIVGCKNPKILSTVFSYFKYVDEKFSTYKRNSEISKINRNEVKKNEYSLDMKKVLKLCEDTKNKTNGFFNAYRNGFCDPSGVVKGWAILNASKIIKKKGFKNFYVEAGGDIQIGGKKGIRKWCIGIKNPFDQTKIVKKILLLDKGIATSGTYIRGQHIYNPKSDKKILDIVSLTVIGPNILEADRFATAAFAMGGKGIYFIEKLKGFEAYIIDNKGMATYTSGFEKYVK